MLLPEGDERYPAKLPLVIGTLSDDQINLLMESAETTNKQAFLTSSSSIRQRD